MIPLERLVTHRASLAGFGRVARALRALAVSRLHQAQSARQVARNRVDCLERMIGRLGGYAGRSPGGAPVLIAIGPEHGFTGSLAARVLDEVQLVQAEMSIAGFIHVGNGLAREARLRGIKSEPIALANHVAGLSVCAGQLFDRLAQYPPGHEIWILGASGNDGHIATSRLQPLSIDPLYSCYPPLIHGDPGMAIRSLIGLLEKSMVDLCLTEGLVAENLARQRRLDSALDGVDERLGELDRQLAGARQDAITIELGDLIGGMIAAA